MKKKECENELGKWMENMKREESEEGVGEKGIEELKKD